MIIIRLWSQWCECIAGERRERKKSIYLLSIVICLFVCLFPLFCCCSRINLDHQWSIINRRQISNLQSTEYASNGFHVSRQNPGRLLCRCWNTMSNVSRLREGGRCWGKLPVVIFVVGYIRIYIDLISRHRSEPLPAAIGACEIVTIKTFGAIDKCFCLHFGSRHEQEYHLSS